MRSIPRRIRSQVRERASHRCEYCGLPEAGGMYPFHVEHIIPLKHQGASTLENLAWACYLCNRYKGTDVALYDGASGILTPLFNPRIQAWEDHFEIVEGEIVGKTATGRVTALLLRFNSPEQASLRHKMIEKGLW